MSPQHGDRGSALRSFPDGWEAAVYLQPADVNLSERHPRLDFDEALVQFESDGTKDVTYWRPRAEDDAFDS